MYFSLNVPLFCCLFQVCLLSAIEFQVLYNIFVFLLVQKELCLIICRGAGNTLLSEQCMGSDMNHSATTGSLLCTNSLALYGNTVPFLCTMCLSETKDKSEAIQSIFDQFYQACRKLHQTVV